MQYRDDMWSVSLRPGQPDKVQAIFEGTGRTMKHQLAVRRRQDTSKVFCMVTSSKEEVVHVGISDAGGSAVPMNVGEAWESLTSKILLVEPDPDDSGALFVLTDE